MARKRQDAGEAIDGIGFEKLESADLRIDEVYCGGRAGNASDDPLSRLLQVSNMGGFRYRGSIEHLELVVLTTSLSDPDWPDGLDEETGILTYYGDNKRPGRDLHGTPRLGNQLLARIYELAHDPAGGRLAVPPIFVFANTGTWRDVRFLGLAVPGTGGLRQSEELVAVWKTVRGNRFQNYRARFTILDVPVIPREWIQHVVDGNALSPASPRAWRAWLNGGRAQPLLAQRSIEHRGREEQLPKSHDGMQILQKVQEYFEERPHAFENCAAALAMMLLPDIASIDVTRPSRDGGRDAIGKLRIGSGQSSLQVEFALEAKCYAPEHSVGVRETARLISRLRHRQFGIVVTTSYLHSQAYREIKEDGHPIIVIAGGDIVTLLRDNGLASAEVVGAWLHATFPDASGNASPVNCDR